MWAEVFFILSLFMRLTDGQSDIERPQLYSSSVVQLVLVMYRVHIGAQRADRYSVVFHIAISYDRLFTYQVAVVKRRCVIQQWARHALNQLSASDLLPNMHGVLAY